MYYKFECNITLHCFNVVISEVNLVRLHRFLLDLELTTIILVEHLCTFNSCFFVFMMSLITGT